MNRDSAGRKERSRELLTEAFLKSGTVSDPAKSYHLEIACDTGEEASSVAGALGTFGISPGVAERRGRYSVYLKESQAISDLLAVMGATNALLRLQDVMVLREVKGNVQRLVNCETANIRKTASAYVRQAEDIRYILEHGGLSELSDGLKETAELRLKYPEASLSELAEMMPGTGRSGVNHRLRKLSGIAERMKKQSDMQ